VVTGAGSGIGRALALRLARRDLEVLAVGRRVEPLDRIVREIASRGGRARAVPCDLADPVAVRRVLGAAGSVAAVAACHGLCRQARLDDPDADEAWDEVVGANLHGTWHLLRAVGPGLAPGGSVVAVASGLGRNGRAGYAAYAVSKHGLLGLVRCLARELAERDVTVNAVCPGWVDTGMAAGDLARTAAIEGVSPEAIRARALAGIPLGRFVAPDEVAALCAWLLSPDARAITGQAYDIAAGEFTS
jgi:3-hydroxybutyrate dehydrogenase